MEQNSKLTQWLIAHSGGAIKDRKQADKAILIFSVIAIIISLFLLVKSIHTTPASSAQNGTPRPSTGVTNGFPH